MTLDPQRQLQTFLDEEVIPESVGILLGKAQAVRDGQADASYSGNAYSVTFEAGEAVIRHHHVPDWPALHLSLDVFIEHLQAWQTPA